LFANEESAAAAYNAAVRALVNEPVNENEVPDITIRNARWQGKFKGVRKEKGRFFAVVWLAGRMLRIGTFDTAIEAAIAYDAYVIKNIGEHVKTNKELGLLDEAFHLA
jgi:hypothetical protein